MFEREFLACVPDLATAVLKTCSGEAASAVANACASVVAWLTCMLYSGLRTTTIVLFGALSTEHHV